MKLTTFNIRLDTPDDGALGYPRRKAFIFDTIARRQPEILCFQEVLPHVAADIRENLNDYMVVGMGRDERLRDEQCTIAFKKDRFNLMELQNFWLSETPYVPGSRYKEQSICPRICTMVLLEDMTNNKIFRVIDTHLDHIGSEARALGLRQILRAVEDCRLFPDAPVLLAGDFNAEPGSPELEVFNEYKGWRNLTEGIGVTWHGFGRTEGEAIDYVFARGGWNLNGTEKWLSRRGGLWLSDHFPVSVDVDLP